MPHEIKLHPNCDKLYVSKKCRYMVEIATTRPNTILYGLETLSYIYYRSSVVWSLTPAVIKASSTLTIFKNRIKSWKCEDCPWSANRLSLKPWIYLRQNSPFFVFTFLFIISVYS